MQQAAREEAERQVEREAEEFFLSFYGEDWRQYQKALMREHEGA